MQAIVIVTHKLDLAIAERFKRLSKVKGFDTFVLLDNYKAPNIQDFDYIRVFNFPDIKKKYKVFKENKLVPGSNNFPVIDFILKNGYSHVWAIEFDCIFKGDWNDFFKEYKNSNADLITAGIRTKVDDTEWGWWHELSVPVEIPDTELFASFNPVYRMSKEAAEVLFQQNQEGWHGHHESTMVTGLKYAGMKVEELKHCNQHCYQFRPDLLDREYISKTGNILIHPVK
jgi:hypothetical protein